MLVKDHRPGRQAVDIRGNGFAAGVVGMDHLPLEGVHQNQDCFHRFPVLSICIKCLSPPLYGMTGKGTREKLLVFWYYPLIEPIMTPWVKYFCAKEDPLDR